MYRKSRMWCSILLGVAAGVLVYMLVPANWLLFVMCVIVIYITITNLFC